MSYSLTLNYTVPATGFQFVTGYRVKYWPTNSPLAVSTVNIQGFPLVITDLSATSYSGTIESKCGDTYSTAKSFGPIAVVSSGGGGSSAPACPYKIILYADDTLTVPIGGSNNQTSCVRYAYRVKLVTAGNAPVTVTGSEVSIPITYQVLTGDCASPNSSQSLSVNLTIPAGMSESSNYVQTANSFSSISAINFGTGTPTTVMGCATTYVNSSGQTATGGNASFSGNGTCTQGHGTYTLTGNAYDTVVVQLRCAGNISATNAYNFGNQAAAYLYAGLAYIINGSMGSTKTAYSECVYQGSNYVTITATLTVSMPASGSVTIDTNVIKYNSETFDSIQSELSIVSVNGGLATGQYIGITNVCSTNSQGQSQCPGPGSGSGNL
jgi:hypothetical protein